MKAKCISTVKRIARRISGLEMMAHPEITDAPICEEELGCSRTIQVNERIADISYRRTDGIIGQTGSAMKKIALLLITLLTFQQALIPPISAQYYKYVDKNGVSHYTNTPNDPRYQNNKIKSTDPKKKNRPTIKKSNKYKKPPQTTKSSTSPRPR